MIVVEQQTFGVRSGVSVIIPTKDRLSWLQRVVPTYLSQLEVAEIIVVVDGCTDGTLEYVKQLASRDRRVRYIDNGKNRGIPFSKNVGIDAARSDYIFFGEDDLELTDGFLGILMNHLEEFDVDVISGRNVWRYENESEEHAIARTDEIGDSQVDFRMLAINTSARLKDDTIQFLLANPMLAKSDVFRRIKFDERYRVNFWREESDFQLSAQERGYKLASCPHAICFNYIIQNDTGGVHGTLAWRRLAWITINNWRFVMKHRKFISANFRIGNQYVYLARMTGSKFVSEMLLPWMIQAKRRVIRILG